ncbi:hypothetical protein B296_00013546 [Ensete ventricosum]|uniref:Uncharacterized protein n=1 Tax=Ensete ventricosum TaxID=4639 RepID=A0A426X8I2_ENSVE|nr:hypothetical protein B296_00013546 [Ensete ventricosum]
MSPTTRWRRPCMRVAVYLSIDQRELLGGHSGVEAGGQKGRGSDDESSGAQLPKIKALVRKEVDLEEHYSLAAPWYYRGGTSVESSIPCSHGGRALVVKGAKEVENAEANSKYQDMVEAKEHHMTGVDGLLIKIAKSEGYGLMQDCSTKEQSRQYTVLYLFYLEEYATKVMEKTIQSQKRPELSKIYYKLGDSKLG